MVSTGQTPSWSVQGRHHHGQYRADTIMVSTCTHWVQEEEEFPDSCADVEGVERFLQALELWECGDQLQDVILQVLGGGAGEARGGEGRKERERGTEEYMQLDKLCVKEAML